MKETLTIKEIEKQFDSEWVLLDDPKTDETQRVVSGQVLAHSRSRDDVDRCLLARRPRHYAMIFTGRIPEDAAIIL